LASPHFGTVVIVYDGVIRFEAAVMEALILIDPRIIVVGET
jgi:hypothetical protein